MTYAYVIDVPMPITEYDTVHQEVGRRAGDRIEGLLVHVARATAQGFQLIEVWESKEQCDRFNNEVVGPVMAERASGQAPPGEPTVEEFQPHGLIVAGVETTTSHS
jgi:hypothetical protein